MRYEFIKIVNIELFMKKKEIKNNNVSMTYRGKGEKEEKDIVWKGYVAEIRGELFLILIRKAKFAKHLMQRYAIICTAACTAPIELYLSLSLFLYSLSPLSLTRGEMQHDYILRGKLLLKWFRVRRNGARTNYSWRLFNSSNSPSPPARGTFRVLRTRF